MNVKLAPRHRQPRASQPVACDHHTGLALESNPDASPVFCNDVQVYNLFMPRLGTMSFSLCLDAVKYLREDV